MRRLALVLCGFLASGVVLIPTAGLPNGRQITVFNRGTQPIYWIQFAPVGTENWSNDVLPFNEVVDVGEARTISVALDRQCIYKVRAVYHDRSEADLSAVDLCIASSLSFDH